MERGYIGGLNYRMTFPTQQGVPTGVRQPTQQQEEVEGYDYELPKDPIAVRRELTAGLYKDYANLKSIVAAAEKAGVDVTRPDLSQSNGGLLHNMYLEADAAVRYGTNALAREREMEDQMIPYLANNQVLLNPNVDRTRDMWATRGQYTSTEPLPFVDEANKFTQENTYTQRDQDRYNAEYFDPTVEEIDEMVENGQLSPQAGDMQKAYLKRNTSQVYAPGYFRKEDDGGKKKRSYLAFHDNIGNLTRGVFPDQAREIIWNGKQYKVIDALQGDSFGKENIRRFDKSGNPIVTEVNKEIRDVVKDDEGNVFIRFKDDIFEPINVTDMSPTDVVRTLMESNGSKYGGSGAVVDLYDELQQAGRMDSSMMTNSNSVVGSGAAERAQRTKPNIPGFDRIQEQFKRDYDELVAKGGQRVLNVPGKDGTVFQFGYSEEDGVFLKNWKELGYKESKYIEGNEPVRPTKITFDKYQDIVDKIGAFERFLGERESKQKESSARSREAEAERGKILQNLTANQQRAIVEFRIKNKREPNEQELQMIVWGTQKAVKNPGGKKAY